MNDAATTSTVVEAPHQVVGSPSPGEPGLSCANCDASTSEWADLFCRQLSAFTTAASAAVITFALVFGFNQLTNAPRPNRGFMDLLMRVALELAGAYFVIDDWYASRSIISRIRLTAIGTKRITLRFALDLAILLAGYLIIIFGLKGEPEATALVIGAVLLLGAAWASICLPETLKAALDQSRRAAIIPFACLSEVTKRVEDAEKKCEELGSNASYEEWEKATGDLRAAHGALAEIQSVEIRRRELWKGVSDLGRVQATHGLFALAFAVFLNLRESSKAQSWQDLLTPFVLFVIFLVVHRVFLPTLWDRRTGCVSAPIADNRGCDDPPSNAS